MKRTTFALTIISTLFLLVPAGTELVNLAGANPTMFKKGRYCNISIQFPQNGTTYGTEQIFLNFTVRKAYVSDTYSYFYFLDGQDVQLGIKVEEIQSIGQEAITNDTFFPYTEYTLRGQSALPKLGDGPHNLTVFIGWMREDGVIFHANIDPFSTTAYFSVDHTTTPTPSPSPLPQETESEPFPTTWVANGIVSAAVVSVGLLVYFKKRYGKG